MTIDAATIHQSSATRFTLGPGAQGDVATVCGQSYECRRKAGIATSETLPLQVLAETYILVHMKTTLNIDDRLLAEARRLVGIDEKTALVHAGLEALIARESAKRLSALGGTEPALKRVPRRRSSRKRVA